jgi:Mg-chelatase subunit ChlD
VTIAAACIGAVAVILAAVIQRPVRDSEKSLINTEFLVDVSKGMNNDFAVGVTKLEAAKKAVEYKIQEFSEKDSLGLRKFGGECDSSDNTELLVNLKPDTKNRIINKLQELRPLRSGQTPLTRAVVEATRDFSQQRFAHVRTRLIVITGTGDWCYSNPAQKIHQQLQEMKSVGRDIKIEYSFIGLALSPSEEEKLEKIAQMTEGEVYLTKNFKELYEAIGIEPKLASRNWPDLTLYTRQQVMEIFVSPSGLGEVTVTVENQGGLLSQGASLLLLDRKTGQGLSRVKIPPVQSGMSWNTSMPLKYDEQLSSITMQITAHEGPDFDPSNDQINREVQWVLSKARSQTRADTPMPPKEYQSPSQQQGKLPDQSQRETRVNPIPPSNEARNTPRKQPLHPLELGFFSGVWQFGGTDIFLDFQVKESGMQITIFNSQKYAVTRIDHINRSGNYFSFHGYGSRAINRFLIIDKETIEFYADTLLSQNNYSLFKVSSGNIGHSDLIQKIDVTNVIDVTDMTLFSYGYHSCSMGNIEGCIWRVLSPTVR